MQPSTPDFTLSSRLASTCHRPQIAGPVAPPSAYTLRPPEGKPACKANNSTPRILDALLRDPGSIEAIENAGIAPEEFLNFVKYLPKKR